MWMFLFGLFVGAGIGLVTAAMLGANGRDKEDEGVLDLLETIHRDGGHHTEAVGVEQSVKDAMHLVRWVPIALTLLREVMAWHRDPQSADYNECDTAPCEWCKVAAQCLYTGDTK